MKGKFLNRIKYAGACSLVGAVTVGSVSDKVCAALSNSCGKITGPKGSIRGKEVDGSLAGAATGAVLGFVGGMIWYDGSDAEDAASEAINAKTA